jgi:hypothetical protein
MSALRDSIKLPLVIVAIVYMLMVLEPYFLAYAMIALNP